MVYEASVNKQLPFFIELYLLYTPILGVELEVRYLQCRVLCC